MLKTFFAVLGATSFALYVLGTLGIGHFVFYYGGSQPTCSAPAGGDK